MSNDLSVRELAQAPREVASSLLSVSAPLPNSHIITLVGSLSAGQRQFGAGLVELNGASSKPEAAPVAAPVVTAAAGPKSTVTPIRRKPSSGLTL